MLLKLLYSNKFSGAQLAIKGRIPQGFITGDATTDKYNYSYLHLVYNRAVGNFPFNWKLSLAEFIALVWLDRRRIDLSVL